jgi:hypothetical protein
MTAIPPFIPESTSTEPPKSAIFVSRISQCDARPSPRHSLSSHVSGSAPRACFGASGPADMVPCASSTAAKHTKRRENMSVIPPLCRATESAVGAVGEERFHAGETPAIRAADVSPKWTWSRS